VVAIVGQQHRAALGGNYQQEVDLLALFNDVAKEYVHMCSTPAQMRHLIDRAMRIAMSERSVTCVIVPTTSRKWKLSSLHTSTALCIPVSDMRGRAWCRTRMRFTTPPICSTPAARSRWWSGRAHCMPKGGARGGRPARRGHAKALLGKAVVPDDLPFVTGAIGLLGTNRAIR
jgi:pyruvate dehydrogenase (quinone)